jgi:Zn finger protein HypA/HybF involved in hydrogenase expression
MASLSPEGIALKNLGMALEQTSSSETKVPVECKLVGEESSAEYWRWCPRCGHELHNEKCKLRCPRCHYFMSCSDFD